MALQKTLRVGFVNVYFMITINPSRLHGLVTARQNDRSTIAGLERRLAEERRAKQAAETQVATLERRQKKAEEQAQARAHALATAK